MKNLFSSSEKSAGIFSLDRYSPLWTTPAIFPSTIRFFASIVNKFWIITLFKEKTCSWFNCGHCEGWSLSLGYWVGQNDEKSTPSGAGTVWGMIPFYFPVFWNIAPGCSRNSYGTSPKLRVQKKLVKFWQGTQDAWLCSANFLREFLGYSPLDLLGDLGDLI